jgi:hypothetical protein
VSFIPPTTSADPTPLKLLTNGEPEPAIDEERASVILAEEDLEVLIDLGVEGGQSAKYWTCDFSHVGGRRFGRRTAASVLTLALVAGIRDHQWKRELECCDNVESVY